jgi:alkylated DNA repair dioxygenase AlkB
MPTLLDAGFIRIEDGFVPDAAALFAALLGSVAWDGRMKARKAASFGLPYNYSGIVWPAAPFPAEIVPLLHRVAARVGFEPNNCLAHHYPDAVSRMGFHADSTDELAPGTGIAVVSLGAERAITFRSQEDRTRLEHFPLRPGSLLYMCPQMQADWKHAILPVEGAVGRRISLTFRRMRDAGR